MSNDVLTIENVIKSNTPHRPAFFDSNKIEWKEWIMQGTYFKLLNINELTGGFTMLLKVNPGISAPVHHHVGGIEAFVIEGEFGYGDDDRGGAGSYVLESGGSTHEPTSPGGVVMFAVVYGPIVGYNEDGSIAAVIDGRFMHDLATSNNVADHIVMVNSFTNGK